MSTVQRTASEHPQTFALWLRAQRKRQDPVGDLANSTVSGRHRDTNRLTQ